MSVDVWGCRSQRERNERFGLGGSERQGMPFMLGSKACVYWIRSGYADVYVHETKMTTEQWAAVCARHVPYLADAADAAARKYGGRSGWAELMLTAQQRDDVRELLRITVDALPESERWRAKGA